MEVDGTMVERVRWYLTQINKADDRAVRVAVTRFIDWLFQDSCAQSLAVDLQRRGRRKAVRFWEHQNEILLLVARLFGDLLAICPHPMVDERNTCTESTCQERVRELDTILRRAPLADLEIDEATGAAKNAPPAGRAIECFVFWGAIQTGWP